MSQRLSANFSYDRGSTRHRPCRHTFEASLGSRVTCMNSKDFIRLGIPRSDARWLPISFPISFSAGGDKTKLEEELNAIIANPALVADAPMPKERAETIANTPPHDERVKYRHCGEGFAREAAMRIETARRRQTAVVGASGCRRGSGGDFRRELLDLGLESSHFLQGAFRKDGKLFRLAREQFLPQGSECFAHPLQLLHRLGQNCFSLDHKRTRSSPFLISGASRTRLKNSAYVLYSGLSRSATSRTKFSCNTTF